MSILLCWKLGAGVAELWIPDFPIIIRNIPTGLYPITAVITGLELLRYLYVLFHFVTIFRIRVSQFILTIVSLGLNGGVYLYGIVFFTTEDTSWAGRVLLN
jgi:hypothetical protein